MDCRELFGALISAGEGEQNRSAKMLIAYKEADLPSLGDVAWGSVAYVQKTQKWYTLSPYGRWSEVLLPANTTASDPTTGTLTVTMDIDGAPASAAEKTYKIAVRVDGEYAQDTSGTMGEDAHWFTAADAGDITIAGLLTGAVTIIEDLEDARIDGYTLASVEGTGVTTLTTDGASVTVVNTYEQDFGGLTVTKTVTGAPETAAEKVFEVTITNSDGDYIAADGTTSSEEVKHELANEDTLGIEGLPTGEYTVTELGTEAGGDAQIEGYDLEATGSDAYDLVKDETTTVELLNAYTETPVDPAPESDAPADDTPGEGGE